MNKRLIVLMLLLFPAACGQATQAKPADACFGLNIEKSERTLALKVVDQFSKSNGLDRNDSYRFMNMWEKRDDQGWQVELMFDFVDGAISPLVLFVHDDSMRHIVSKLEAFALSDLEKRWPVKRCSDIKGFSPPHTSRPTRSVRGP